MACFPVCHYPCRTILEDGVRYVLRGRISEGFSCTLHVLLTVFLCGCALATALVTSDLGTVRFLVPSINGLYTYLMNAVSTHPSSWLLTFLTTLLVL